MLTQDEEDKITNGRFVIGTRNLVELSEEYDVMTASQESLLGANDDGNDGIKESDGVSDVDVVILDDS